MSEIQVFTAEDVERKLSNLTMANARQKAALDRLLDQRQGLIKLVNELIDGMPDVAGKLWQAELEKITDGDTKKDSGGETEQLSDEESSS